MVGGEHELQMVWGFLLFIFGFWKPVCPQNAVEDKRENYICAEKWGRRNGCVVLLPCEVLCFTSPKLCQASHWVRTSTSLLSDSLTSSLRTLLLRQGRFPRLESIVLSRTSDFIPCEMNAALLPLCSLLNPVLSLVVFSGLCLTALC